MKKSAIAAMGIAVALSVSGQAMAGTRASDHNSGKYLKGLTNAWQHASDHGHKGIENAFHHHNGSSGC